MTGIPKLSGFRSRWIPSHPSSGRRCTRTPADQTQTLAQGSATRQRSALGKPPMDPIDGCYINVTFDQLCGRGHHHHQGRHLIKPSQHQALDPGGLTLKSFMLISHHPKLPGSLVQTSNQMDLAIRRPKNKVVDL
jgi:hypothetical protein